MSSKKSFSRSSQYHKWTEKDRYDIGKYCAENGNVAALRKFKNEFRDLEKSTVRTFKKRNYEEARRVEKDSQV